MEESSEGGSSEASEMEPVHFEKKKMAKKKFDSAIEEVDTLDELMRMDWFVQSKSGKVEKVHVVKKMSKDGKHIPLCRSKPFPHSAKGAGTNIYAIDVPGKRGLCSRCCDNLSPEQRLCLGLP